MTTPALSSYSSFSIRRRAPNQMSGVEHCWMRVQISLGPLFTWADSSMVEHDDLRNEPPT